MLDRCQQLAVGDLVTAQLVGDQHARHVPQALEQLTEESLGRHRISAGLDENVEHVAVLVDRAPHIPQPAVDPDEHLVEVPLVAGARAPPAQLVGVGLPELGAPPPDRLVTHRNTAYEHQLLDLTEAEREPEVQPHAVVDDLDRVAVALVRRRCGGHPTNPPRSPTPTNVTVPRSCWSARAAISARRRRSASSAASQARRTRTANHAAATTTPAPTIHQMKCSTNATISSV